MNNEGKLYLIIFQITVGEVHSVNTNGLKTIINAYPENIRKQIERSFLVFLTPNNNRLNSKQRLVTQMGTDSTQIPSCVQEIVQCYCRYTLTHTLP